jgi:hypothetical protein
MRTALLAALGACLASSATQAAAPDCDRACLSDVAEKYLAALLEHDPSKVAMARNVRYTEGGVELPLPDGLWRTVGSIGKYRLFVTDPKESTVGFFVKAQEDGAPVLIATRLKVVGHRITEIESIGARLGATLGGGPSGVPRVDQLGDETRKQVQRILIRT